ncbi:toxin-antitoxin system HicB family antitoxin [Nostoc sp.]|uniref:type II toxin-antitoxin system HicB family antitoxin n=1 Tax=Nostoc sp. TaxID=1180 RepID=UPI002FEF5A05
MVNYDHYTYKVTWSSEDEEFVGLCAEFPSLSFLDKNRNTALEGITDLVRDVVADMGANNETIPEPISEKNYSGKFVVRISPEHHRRLAIGAAEQKVSLNRYVSLKLAC